MDVAGQVGNALLGAGHEGLGRRLRDRRQHLGLSLRELSRRIGVSPSLLSQVETGKVQPSVPTLYALVTELGGSLDALLFGEPNDGNGGTTLRAEVPRSASPGTGHRWEDHPPMPLVQRAHDRKTLQLGHGVRWERLTRESLPGVEFLHVTYEPGAESGAPDEYQRHTGREWCYVVSGELQIVVGFDSYTLAPGDAITFDATTPHRLCNNGGEPAVSIWFQLR